MKSRSYDNFYSPPALIVDVNISNPELKESRNLRGKLDTGSDATVFPEMLARDLKLVPASEVAVRGSLDERSNLPTYFVNIEFCGYPFEYVEAVATKYRYDVLIGRDILNKLKLIANGPKLKFIVG